MRHLLSIVGLGLLLVRGADAQMPIFAWDYPRERNAEAFLLSANNAGSRLTWQTAPSAPGACGPGTSPDLYCTRLPACPPLGSVTFEVVAVVASTPSAPSDPSLPCEVPTQTPCTVVCANPPGGPPGGSVARAGVPETGAPGTVFATNDGRLILDVSEVPTQEPTVLPAVETVPALPLFQPAPSRAPV